MTPTEETHSIISHVCSKLPKDKQLHSFTTLFLQSIPTRSIKEFDTATLVTFITNRFKFLSESLLNSITIKLTSYDDTSSSTLEILTKDAMFLLVTIENVLSDNGIQITKLFHPTLQIQKDVSGKLISIEKSEEGQELTSISYMELDKSLTKLQITAIKKNLHDKILAVTLAQKCHNNMMDQLMEVKNLVAQHTIPLQEFHQEWVDLLDWLKNYNFSFFGSCIFSHSITENKHTITLKKGSSLGILSKEFSTETGSNLLDTLHTHVDQLKEYRSPFLFDTIHFTSPIQRFENLMRLSLKIPVSKTETVEYIFLGLLKRSSLMAKNLDTPIIRKKIAKIFEAKHMMPSSYDFNQTIRLFTATPKFELFRTPTEHLLRMIDDLLSITNLNEIYCFTRSKIDPSKEFLMIVIPQKLFTESNIKGVLSLLEKKTGTPIYESIEATNGLQCRLHVYFDVSHTSLSLDTESLENDIRLEIKPWEDRLKTELITTHGIIKGKQLYNNYIDHFPHHHRVRRTPEETLRDINALEALQKEKTTQFNLVPFNFKDSVLYGTASILFIYNEEKINLIQAMAVIQNLGIHVFDEITTRVGSREKVVAYIHQFRICHLDGSKMTEDDYKDTLLPLLKRVFNGGASNDSLNAFAVNAKLSWKQIQIFQLYREFMTQIESQHSREKINATLLKHPISATYLINYFETKFNPQTSFKSTSHRKTNSLPAIEYEFLDSLRHVIDISEDLVLRQIFSLIKHTLRSNYFIPKENGHSTLSVKLEPKHITMPQPVPFREIFVYDPEMEGTHLRFGPVSRGGLRWSNRLNDFRKEVLGLVKTQQTKNVVIVPVGSKGGFVIKKEITAENAAYESKKQYQKFIKALLDITDTIDGSGKVKHPKHVVQYDGEDPYLVVAADKGTATFSDFANDISDEYKFWLGDAFASGGSVGYNHKEVGITAKGAWECTKLHFLEKGIDIQNEHFTVSGVGDMSGDVFGNGLLLSPYIKLQTAFNHVHIFIDPNPDIEKSFKERDRLFNLPRSSWLDYNKDLISKGGGIFERKAKEITLTPEIQALLTISKSVVNGEELINAILKMNVDLLWLGGIGTYIKSQNQTHYDVGDPANDSIRINTNECKAKVIGEGANLGITQVSRIELSERLVQINTDFIDNSAGVNMSDYEVNIKILLKRLLEENIIKSTEERNTILAAATDQVTELVLYNNRGQHCLLSMDQIRSKEDFSLFNKLIQTMISSKKIDPVTENIPSQTQLDKYKESTTSFPRPLLAVLQSYVKMDIFEKLVNSEFLNHPFVDPLYKGYFPELILTQFSNQLDKHRLKKEIIATQITNKIVNQAGICFFFQAEQRTGKPASDIAQLYLSLESILNIDAIRSEILASSTSYQTKYKLLISIEKNLQHMIINSLHLPSLPELTPLISELTSIFTIIRTEVGHHKKEEKSSLSKLLKSGLTESLALNIAELDSFLNISDLLHLNQIQDADLPTSLKLLKTINSTLHFEWLSNHLYAQSTETQWESSQQDILIQTLKLQAFNLIKRLVSEKTKENLVEMKPTKLVDYLHRTFPGQVDMYFQTFSQLKATGTINLTSLTVVVNRLNFLNCN